MAPTTVLGKIQSAPWDWHNLLVQEQNGTTAAKGPKSMATG